MIFLSGLHPRLLPYFRPFSSASREFRDVVTFTTQDRSRRPAEIHCVLGGNKSSRPIAWTWWKSVALLGEIKGQCLVVKTPGEHQNSKFYMGHIFNSAIPQLAQNGSYTTTRSKYNSPKLPLAQNTTRPKYFSLIPIDSTL